MNINTLERLKEQVTPAGNGDKSAYQVLTESLAFALLAASPNIDTDFHGEYNEETGGFDLDFTYMGYPGKFRVYPPGHTDGINIFIQHPSDTVCFGVADVKSIDGIAEALSVAKNRADKDYHTGNPVELKLKKNSVFVISDTALLEHFRPTYTAWRDAWVKCVDYGDTTREAITSLGQVIEAIDGTPTPEECHDYAEEYIGIDCYVELADVTLRLLKQIQEAVPNAIVFMPKGDEAPLLYFGVPSRGLTKRTLTPDGAKVVADLGGDGCFSDEYFFNSISNRTGWPLPINDKPRRLLTNR